MSRQCLTPFQRAIIGHIIAGSSGGKPPEYLREYFQAFEGVFSADRTFTLHTPVKNKIYLYYNAADFKVLYMERRAFTGICENIKKRLVDIALFITFLIDKGCVVPDYKQPSCFELPKDSQKHWRRYQEFYPSESEPILFVKSITPIPSSKLYSLAAPPAGGGA
jgi:hypothetical protein